MKFCPVCGAPIEGNTTFCSQCGSPVNAAPNAAPNPAPNAGFTAPANYGTPNAQPPYGYGAVYANPYDHTSEFDAKDISDNKVICMMIYLTGFIGILIALLASNSSKYVAFHVRQGLKFQVVSILTTLVSLLLFWTFIVPIAAGILSIALFVVQIICFFDICKGKAKEPAIIRNLNFLK